MEHLRKKTPVESEVSKTCLRCDYKTFNLTAPSCRRCGIELTMIYTCMYCKHVYYEEKPNYCGKCGREQIIANQT